jgi:hypothetical protein
MNPQIVLAHALHKKQQVGVIDEEAREEPGLLVNRNVSAPDS